MKMATSTLMGNAGLCTHTEAHGPHAIDGPVLNSTRADASSPDSAAASSLGINLLILIGFNMRTASGARIIFLDDFAFVNRGYFGQFVTEY